MPIAAYHPTLSLVESYTGTYKIYYLKNPITEEIFYVGQTMNSLSERLAGHISETGSTNRDKILFIKSILDKGYRPTIHEIETIHVRCYIDHASVNEREGYWIKHYRSIGCKLLNIAKPSSQEYQDYLACIKRGQTNWQYYYCGKTHGGWRIYDEERLRLDGFKLSDIPKEEYQTQRVYSTQRVNKYNPWENERFMKMIGYKRCYDDPYTYEHCYKDLDPKYYDQEDY